MVHHPDLPFTEAASPGERIDRVVERLGDY